MSRIAWAYVLGIIGAGSLLAAIAYFNSIYAPQAWDALALFAALATLAQLSKSIFKSQRKSETEGNISFSPLLVFLSAGIFIFSAWHFVLLVLAPHLLEWGNERRKKSTSLRAWYIQPFNIANHICAGLIARELFYFISVLFPIVGLPSNPLAVVIALGSYLILNHLMTGFAVVLARGSSWHDTGMFNWDTLMPDLMLLFMGYPIALLWEQDSWLSLFALAPLFLIQRALAVPQLQKEARVDVKTGLWNSAHFSHLLNGEFERAVRFVRPLSIVMADLDFLRNVNNIYGHLAGDMVLETIGQIIRQSVREYDIAGRFGGEEFAIVLPETNQAMALMIAERIRETIAITPIKVETSAMPIYVTMSCGVSSYPADAQTAKGLLHQADIAVYQAKLQGRNRVISVIDVPQSVKLENLASPIQPPPDVHLTPAVELSAPVAGRVANLKSDNDIVRERKLIPHRLDWIAPFVGTVILSGLIVTFFGLTTSPAFDLLWLGILVGLAVFAEWFEVGMYGDSTLSLSATIVFAAILLSGFAGLVSVSAGIVVAHYFKNRDIEFYKPFFNWATHVLAGLAPLYGFKQFQIPLVWENVIPLTTLTLVTAAGYYIIESGLISIAISLAEKSNILFTWRRQFGWSAIFYISLCAIGLFMAIATRDLNSISGIIVFALPLILMHYVQQQYIQNTRATSTEIIRMNKELSQANHEIQRASLRIEQLNDELFVTLGKIIDARDPKGLDHATNVAEFATLIAHTMKLPPVRIVILRQAALLHDIGKLGISEQILMKPGRLSADEYELIKAHTTIGSAILEASQGLRHLAFAVRYHHERWDGSGYPDGLRGEQIPLEARILSLCDAVQSMASDRPYQRSKSPAEIIVELEKCAGSQFDPTITSLFIDLIKKDSGLLLIKSAKNISAKTYAASSPIANSDEVLSTNNQLT